MVLQLPKPFLPLIETGATSRAPGALPVLEKVGELLLELVPYSGTEERMKSKISVKI